ncbi:unnamed protein product [Mortierella alpina]
MTSDGGDGGDGTDDSGDDDDGSDGSSSSSKRRRVAAAGPSTPVQAQPDSSRGRLLLKSPRRAPWRVPRQAPVKLQHRAPVKRLPRAPAKHLHPRAKGKGGQVMEMRVLEVEMEEGLLPTCGTIAPLPRCTTCSSKPWD